MRPENLIKVVDEFLSLNKRNSLERKEKHLESKNHTEN